MKEIYVNRLKEIIDLSTQIIENKILGKSIIPSNEISFQHEYGMILRTVGNLFLYSAEDFIKVEFEKEVNLKSKSQKSGSNRAKIDIFITYGNHEQDITCAIELKYPKKINKREPNNRYDIFLDIANLENYKSQGVDLAYFYMGTDHKHYVNQTNYSSKTGSFDCRDSKKYKAKTKLIYKTPKPYGKPICLKKDYSFKWSYINKQISFLKLEIYNV